ncbi:MAG: cupin domain-containing protein [Gemmatimonadota bacterium]|nr:MAG: cupin domain-containing protein [Gemmatimonadota bacterium]
MSQDNSSGSRVIRFKDFRWEGIDPVPYKEPGVDWSAVTRQGLVGPDEDAPFHLRYFEIEPGGHTTYERHEHQHVVVVLRGRGEVRLGDRREPVSYGDVVYVAPNEPHQFRATGDEPFGFLCIVTADRDRPRPL